MAHVGRSKRRDLHLLCLLNTVPIYYNYKVNNIVVMRIPTAAIVDHLADLPYTGSPELAPGGVVMHSILPAPAALKQFMSVFAFCCNSAAVLPFLTLQAWKQPRGTVTSFGSYA